MGKKFLKLALIGLAAGTCVSGQFAPLKARPDLSGANAGVQNQESDDMGSDCHNLADSREGGKMTPSTHSKKSTDATRQMKKDQNQSKNMETKRKSAAARVVERG